MSTKVAQKKFLRRKKMNWINSWKKGNKKDKFEATIRFGRITVLELYYNPGREFKFLIFNFGVQL